MKTVSSAIYKAGIFFAPWSIVVAMTTGILLSIPTASIAQQQTNPSSGEQQAGLKEAEQLNQQIKNLDHA